MRFSTRFLLLLSLVLILSVATTAWAGPVSSKLSPAELAKVKAGEIIVKNDFAKNAERGVGTAYGIIKSSTDDFWKVIFDHEHYMDFYPRLEGVNIVERTNTMAKIEFKMDATLKTLTYTTVGTVTPNRMRMDWVLDKERPHKYFKENGGHWQLEQLEPGMLLIEYSVNVALDLGPFSRVASKIVNSMAKDDLPDVILCTKKRIESGGTWVRGKK